MIKRSKIALTSFGQSAGAWPFVVVIVTQMLFAGFSGYTFSSIRSYVTGESLWSKGQHEAIYFLNLYFQTGQEKYFLRYQSAIAIPLADRMARLALEETPPDRAAARLAFLRAGNAREDVSGLIWLFDNFQSFSYLQKAIAQWKKADVLILRLNSLGDAVHAQPISRAKDPQVYADALEHLEAIGTDITPLAVAFSRHLGDGARFVEGTLAAVNFALAGVLAALTVWRVRRFLAHRHEIETELAWQASHDSMTGIANRRAFEVKLGETMKAAETLTPHALMYIDLDQFKIVNDTCGHAAGDALLQRICPLLQATLQTDDMMARLGGDEFGVLLQDASLARATSVAEDMRAAVQSLDFIWGARVFRVTASIGLVHTDQGLTTAEDLMRAADVACFLSKEKGRNRVHVHSAEDRDSLRHTGEMNWVQRIHQALNENRFCLYAQEIAPLAANHEEGLHVEVLIRLLDESEGIIPPASFLPAAERFGLIGLIDRWVVRNVFELLAARMKDHTAAPITCCAINLSGTTIGEDGFLDFLKQAFVTFDVSPHMICFEITETSAITNLEAATAFVRDLRAFGCRFSLDDFGAGMSSFGYLKHLPVDFLKIDGGFVRNMLTNKVDRAMVEMVNHIGHIMGQRIIAEFVEDDELLHALRLIGVDYAQGYWIGRPILFDLEFNSARITRLEAPVRMVA